MKYLFDTTATMKEYNHDKWWIESNIIKQLVIESDSLNNALIEFRNKVNEKYHIEISKNGLKNKQLIYVDTPEGDIQQVGCVITGKTEFLGNNYKWTTQYIDLWVEISTIATPEF